MTRFLTIVMVAIVMLSAGAQAADQRFFSNISDLPLMPGLYELPDAAVVFDKEEGRIVESAAAGEGVHHTQVIDFYTKTLPQLGWAVVSSAPAAGMGLYQRDGEMLNLTARPEGNQGDGVVILQVSLAPLTR
ncbi:hypothetical protein [Micavibrio aeruginosavorus]|uniref:hypothetical protein n=1 Tax=Micavibrio aeruginosavorus TaxID=349221 RepID=UPI003F4AA01B